LISFLDPGPRLVDIRVIKVLDFSSREGTAEYGHAFFPFVFPHDCQTLDVVKVFQIKLLSGF
jgi:hypothetical protein